MAKIPDTTTWTILIVVWVIIVFAAIGLIWWAIFGLLMDPAAIGAFFGEIVRGFKDVTNR